VRAARRPGPALLLQAERTPPPARARAGVYRDLGTASPERFMQASWGRLGGFILSMAWADADEMINTLRGEMAGSRTAGSTSKFPRLSDAEILQQRSVRARGGGAPLLRAGGGSWHDPPPPPRARVQWLLHWSLFVFANYPEVEGDATAGAGSGGVNKGGRDKLIEASLEESSLTAIQLNCPWLLRYVTAAVLVSTDRAAAGEPAQHPEGRISQRYRC